MNKMSQDQIDDDVKQTLPPDVKVLPRIFDFTEDGSSLSYLFAEELVLAAELVYEDGDTRLLDALCRKWPEAVEAGWSEASKEALEHIKRHGVELSAEGKAAMAARAVEREPAALPTRRESARVAAMA